MKKILLFSVLASSLVFISCNDYGKKVKISDKTEVYITHDATEADARKLGEYVDTLYREGNERSLQLSKEKDAFTVKLVVDEKMMDKDPSLMQSFMALRFLLKQKIFPSAEVNLILTDDKFDTYKVVKDTTFSE